MPLERGKLEEIHSVLDRLAKFDADSDVDSRDEKDVEKVLLTRNLLIYSVELSRLKE